LTRASTLFFSLLYHVDGRVSPFGRPGHDDLTLNLSSSFNHGFHGPSFANAASTKELSTTSSTSVAATVLMLPELVEGRTPVIQPKTPSPSPPVDIEKRIR
jgi:hypothetical protein